MVGRGCNARKNRFQTVGRGCDARKNHFRTVGRGCNNANIDFGRTRICLARQFIAGIDGPASPPGFNPISKGGLKPHI